MVVGTIPETGRMPVATGGQGRDDGYDALRVDTRSYVALSFDDDWLFDSAG